jgi:hypothetical protein
MAPGQGHWGNWSNRRQWQWGNGNDQSLPLRSIDRVDVDVWGVGCGRGHFVPCVLFEMLVNAKWRSD